MSDAAPLIGAAVSGLTAAGATAGLGPIAIVIGVGVFAVTAGTALMEEEPKSASLATRQPSDFAGRLSMRIGAAAPQRLIAGLVRISGDPIAAERVSINGRQLVLVLPIARVPAGSGRIAGMGPVYLDAIAITDDQIGANGIVNSGPFKSHVSIYKVLGDQTAAHPWLLTTMPDWRDSDIGRNVAYLVVAMDVGRPSFHTQSIPNVTVDVRGGLWEDTRAGAVIWSDNAVVVTRGWLKTPRFGPGNGAGQIDDDLAEAQANIADEIVPLPQPSVQATVAGDQVTVAIGGNPAALFDGVTTYGTRTSAIAGLADGPAGTIVFALTRLAAGVRQYVFGASNKFIVDFQTNDRIRVFGRTSASTTILQLDSATATPAGGRLFVAASWDLSSGLGHLQIDGVDDLQAGATLTAGDVNIAVANSGLGASNGGPHKLHAAVEFVAFRPSYTDAAGLAALHAAGQAGMSPESWLLFFTGTDNGFYNNQGTSADGSFTPQGTLVPAGGPGFSVKLGDFVAGDSSGGWEGYVSDVVDHGESSGDLVFTLADTIAAAGQGAVKSLPAGAATVTRSASYDVTIAGDRITAPGDYLRVTLGQRVEEYSTSPGGAGFVGYVSNIIVNGFGDDQQRCIFTLADSLPEARAGAIKSLTAGAARITLSGEPRYTINGVISADKVRSSVKRQLEEATAGSIVDSGGTWKIRVGAYAAPTLVIDEKDVVAPLKVATAPPHATSVNRAKGRFSGASTNGQALTYPPFTSAAMLAEDLGQERWLNRDLPYINSPTMATRVMRIAVRRRRRSVTIDSTFMMSVYAVDGGDVVFFDNERWQFNNLPVEIRKRDLYTRKRGGGLTQVIDLTLRETGPADFEDTADELIPAPPPPAGDAAVVPEDVPFFSVTQNDGDVVIYWEAVTDAYDRLDAYDIARGLPGGDPDLATPVTTATKGTTITTKAVPAIVDTNGDPVVQRFWISARNKDGTRSANPRHFDLAVKPVDFDVKVTVPQAPVWGGTLDGFVRFWDGSLVTKSASFAGDLTLEDLFSFVPDPVPLSSYEAPEHDIGHDAADLRVSAEVEAVTLSGVPNPRFQLDHRTEAGSYDGFLDWGLGDLQTAARHLKFRLERDNAANGPVRVIGFTPEIDAKKRTIDFGTVTMDAAGEVFDFDPPFFAPPVPDIKAQGPYLPVQLALSATQATFKLRDPEAAVDVTAPARVQFTGG